MEYAAKQFTAPRPEIALSWRRAWMQGLTPAASITAASLEEIDRDSRLLDAALPVLERVEEDLMGTGFCVALADRDSRLVDMRFGHTAIEQAMENDGAMVGRLYSEEATGTNAVSTVFETRHPISVRGEEHFFDALKKFTCYGVPIRHPVTSHLAGVLNISGLSEHDSPLLGAFITRAARDIEARLMDRSHAAERRLFDAFQRLSAVDRGAPVVGIGPRVFLLNPVAERLLTDIDRSVLRAGIASSNQRRCPPLRLEDGSTYTVELDGVGPSSFVAKLCPSDIALHSFESEARDLNLRERTAIVLITGGEGNGKTHAAGQLAPEATVLHGDEIAEQTTSTWLQAAAAAITETGDVIIDDAHFLPEVAAHRLGKLLDQRSARVVMTMVAGIDDIHPQVRGLAVRATERVSLEPLASTPHRVPQLARDILTGVAPDRHFSEGALAVLAEREWPGNERELAETIFSAVQRTSFPEIAAKDLAESSAANWSTRRLGLLERSERETIRNTLESVDYNKAKAAKMLMISRTTLYKRMNELSIETAKP